MGYFSLMLAGTMIQSKQLRKSILSVFVIVTIIQSTVAALQTGEIYIIEAYLDTTHTMENKISYGLIQHFNWYAGLSVILFACTSGVFLYTNSKAVRNITYAVSLLSFYTLLSAEARLG
ncbi:hypothetical protein [Ruminococcus sp.]|uniref:hypothetical protein n=1 Tax=Ruminococcus sp. TaxID=41978 RepID=UPI0025EFBA1B|nr:hypothetical protein [Ruminococcus sp.]